MSAEVPPGGVSVARPHICGLTVQLCKQELFFAASHSCFDCCSTFQNTADIWIFHSNADVDPVSPPPEYLGIRTAWGTCYVSIIILIKTGIAIWLDNH